MPSADCPTCHRGMETASLSDGGYVAWFCRSCERVFPAEGIDARNSTPAVDHR